MTKLRKIGLNETLSASISAAQPVRQTITLILRNVKLWLRLDVSASRTGERESRLPTQSPAPSSLTLSSFVCPCILLFVCQRLRPFLPLSAPLEASIRDSASVYACLYDRLTSPNVDSCSIAYFTLSLSIPLSHTHIHTYTHTYTCIQMDR
ncbi:unnamed protein product [Protopolystoma xenopodis]|uniref:Uncharacterized protein n=1 Tax=Protopolystoma xenopodis TaxID=117903 RepID=A0A3S5B1F2_9PLAT|nr:unnamed protein product [Protopolystoma xenopodis]